MAVQITHNVDCDFCGKVKPYLANTSRGCLCYDCLKTYQVEIKESIHQINRERQKERQKSHNASMNIENKKLANEALLKMAGGQFDVTGKKISVE